MNEEQRKSIREANRRRSNCGQCNNSSIETVDGSKIGGMPGIKYKYCNSCGWSKAIVRRMPKRGL